MKRFLSLAAICIVATSPGVALAHHSTAANFDESKMVEIEGVISANRLRNPHITFVVDVVNNAGGTDKWTIESNSLSGLRRLKVSTEVFAVGERVRVAGNPSRHSPHGIWATNVMRDDGSEVLVDPGSEPIWTTEDTTSGTPLYTMEGDPSQPELGIFRTWSHTRATNMLFPETTVPDFDIFSYPLTDSARSAVESFDPVTQNPTLNCAPKGMPTIMEQPYPMEFVDQGDRLLVRMEEYDIVRTIHLDLDATPEGTEHGPLGFSTGRWDGNTLRVRTDHVSWGWFDQAGIPLSDDVQIDEEFRLSEDGSRLDFKITVTDSSTFTQPVSLEKFWLYVPGVEVKPYECLAE